MKPVAITAIKVEGNSWQQPGNNSGHGLQTLAVWLNTDPEVINGTIKLKLWRCPAKVQSYSPMLEGTTLDRRGRERDRSSAHDRRPTDKCLIGISDVG